MPAVSLTPVDLAHFASIPELKAAEMIATAMASAARVAPCIRDATLSEDNAEAAKGIIREAVLRWSDAGSGAIVQTTAGPYSQSVNTQVPHRRLFWRSEIAELRRICRDHAGLSTSGTYAVDTAPVSPITGLQESWT